MKEDISFLNERAASIYPDNPGSWRSRSANVKMPAGKYTIDGRDHMIEWIIILILLIVLGVVLVLYILQEKRIESRSREIFEAWRASERQDLAEWKAGELERLSEEKAGILFAGWKADEEAIIRSDAVRRSESVTRGKITEHLIPYFPDFPYNPKDARFLGSPVDLVVFDGLSDDTLREIVFVEIKTAKNPSLSRREREVRDCVSEKRIGYKLLQLVPETEC